MEYNDHSYRGNGVSTDIVEAGALAYLEVINRISTPNNGKPGGGYGPGNLHQTRMLR